MSHPIAGLFISGRLGDHHGVALVERLTRKRDGRIVLVVRAHGGEDVLIETGDSWADGQRRCQGRRYEVPVTHVLRVWPGPTEAWVDAEDYLDWAESEGGAA